MGVIGALEAALGIPTVWVVRRASPKQICRLMRYVNGKLMVNVSDDDVVFVI